MHVLIPGIVLSFIQFLIEISLLILYDWQEENPTEDPVEKPQENYGEPTHQCICLKRV